MKATDIIKIVTRNLPISNSNKKYINLAFDNIENKINSAFDNIENKINYPKFVEFAGVTDINCYSEDLGFNGHLYKNIVVWHKTLKKFCTITLNTNVVDYDATHDLYGSKTLPKYVSKFKQHQVSGFDDYDAIRINATDYYELMPREDVIYYVGNIENGEWYRFRNGELVEEYSGHNTDYVFSSGTISRYLNPNPESLNNKDNVIGFVIDEKLKTFLPYPLICDRKYSGDFIKTTIDFTLSLNILNSFGESGKTNNIGEGSYSKYGHFFDDGINQNRVTKKYVPVKKEITNKLLNAITKFKNFDKDAFDDIFNVSYDGSYTPNKPTFVTATPTEDLSKMYITFRYDFSNYDENSTKFIFGEVANDAAYILRLASYD